MKTDISIVRISNTKYSFNKSTAEGIQEIAKALTFINPAEFAQNRRIKKFDQRNLTFNIGMLPTLETHIRMNGLSVYKEDYDYSLPAGIEIDPRMSGKYIHQRKAVEAFFKRRFGIIEVPTRGGKTFIASEIIRIFLETEKGNVLFCTDNTTLFNQAVGDLKEFFANYGGLEVGEIKAGKVDTSKRVTVAMIQTIQSTFSDRCKDKAKKKSLQAYIKDLKFLCVDEIHDNCSNSKLKLYKKCKNLDFQLCLSATPYRSGAWLQNLKLRDWSGDVLYKITEETLRKREVLSEYKVFMLLIDHNLHNHDLDRDDYIGHKRKLIYDNKIRNNILLQTIEILRKLKRKTLLIFQSVEHGRKVSRLTGIPFISGATKSEERERAKEKFLEEEGGFLLASEIFKKGVTLPAVEVLINVDGGLEDAQTVQKKGRVLGTTAGKKRSLIIDFFDIHETYFTDHSETRLNVYIESIGEKKLGILDTEIDDWNETLRRWIIKWLGKGRDFSVML